MALALATAAIIVLGILVAAAYLLPEPPEPRHPSGPGTLRGPGASAT